METLLEKIKKVNEILKDDELFKEIHIAKGENEKFNNHIIIVIFKKNCTVFIFIV